MVPKVDHPTRTLTLARTLWGDQCLVAVPYEISRLILPAWMLCFERLLAELADSGCCGLERKALL